MKDKLIILLEREFKTLEETEFFDQLLDESEIQRSSNIIITNINIIEKDLNLKEAKVIIAVGDSSLEKILGIRRVKVHRGKILYSDKLDCKVIPTLSIFDTLKSKKVLIDKRFIVNDIKLSTKILSYTSTIKHNYVCISATDRETFDRLISKLEILNLFSFDIEVAESEDWNIEKAKILGIGFSWKSGTGVYIVLRDRGKIIDQIEYDYRINKIKKLLENSAEKIVHNCAYELSRLECIPDLKIKCNNILWDTMLMHHLYNENSRHSLNYLSNEYVSDLANYKDESEIFISNKGSHSFINIPTLILARRCAADCDLTFRLYLFLKEELLKVQLMSIYLQIIILHRHILTKGEIRGVQIDKKELDKIDPIIKNNRDITLKQIRELLQDQDFNPGSHVQVRKKLFEFVNSEHLFLLEKTDKGEISTNENSLKILAEKGYNFPKLLISYRQLSKLYSTYIEGIRKRLTKYNIIHTSYNVAGTVTGRLSSSNPNLQNIPTNFKLTEDYNLSSDISIKKLFIPRKGYKFIVSDGSQIELRILAQLSEDPILIDTFKNNGDIHTVTALEIVPGADNILTQLKKEPKNEILINKWADIRTKAKRVNFGVAYGISAEALASKLKISVTLAKQFLEKFMEQYRGVYEWIQKTIGFAKRNGYVLNLFDRRRRLLDINSSNIIFRNNAERQCINAPIQSSAADCTAIANIRSYKNLMKAGLDAHFILNVHDELVYEVREDQIQEASELIRQGWLEPIPRLSNVSLDVSIEVGDLWEH